MKATWTLNHTIYLSSKVSKHSIFWQENRTKTRVCLYIFQAEGDLAPLVFFIHSGALSLRALACRSHEDHPQSTLRKSFRGFAFPLLLLMPKHRQEEQEGRSGTVPTWQSSPCPLEQTCQMCRLHLHIWKSNPQSKPQIPSLLAVNWSVCSCCRVGGQQGSTAAAILCVCRSPVSSSLHPSLLFLPSPVLFQTREQEERNEWHSLACASCVKRNPNAALPP